MNETDRFLKQHERRKRMRTVFEIIMLAALLFVLIDVLFVTKHYVRALDEDAVANPKNGFIAISYVGVDRYGNNAQNLISKQRLDEQVAALLASGYTTITEEDVIDYYKNGTPLPQKALLLMFEDGRRDTAIFASDVIEKYNCHAMMFSYADKMEIYDNKFLSAGDLKELLDSTYWDIGTNGYRLEYINVYDRYKHFIGRLNSAEFSDLSQYIHRDYDHYLMDFIRDRDGVAIENYSEMKNRIELDYDKMKTLYSSRLGFIPSSYCLMHANSKIKYGTNELVSAENEEQIKNTFTLCFNREGYSVNNLESTPLDLTRLQPQAYWYTNHLLMRIWDDTKQDIRFVTGDTAKASGWNVEEGAAEYKDNSIILTSMPSGFGRVKKSGINVQNLEMDVRLKGNMYGSQGVYLRGGEKLSTYIYAGIENDVLTVEEKSLNGTTRFAQIDMYDFFNKAQRSVEEDERDGQIMAQDIILKSDASESEKQHALAKKEELLKEDVKTLQEGGEEYRPETDLLSVADYEMKITLNGDRLSVWIDNQPVLKDQKVSVTGGGSVWLEAAVQHDTFSQRNIYDDVYDGVFENLSIREIQADGQTSALYNYTEGLDRVWVDLKNTYEDVAKWFKYVF